jgi:hypothetical protein
MWPAGRSLETLALEDTKTDFWKCFKINSPSITDYLKILRQWYHCSLVGRYQCLGEICCLHILSTWYVVFSILKMSAERSAKSRIFPYHKDPTTYVIWTDVSFGYQEERTPLNTAMTLRRNSWLAKQLLVSQEALSNVPVECLALLLHNREVPDSSLD